MQYFTKNERPKTGAKIQFAYSNKDIRVAVWLGEVGIPEDVDWKQVKAWWYIDEDYVKYFCQYDYETFDQAIERLKNG
jgi:hypothetical protein